MHTTNEVRDRLVLTLADYSRTICVLIVAVPVLAAVYRAHHGLHNAVLVDAALVLVEGATALTAGAPFEDDGAGRAHDDRGPGKCLAL